jgi:hypothetical protein
MAIATSLDGRSNEFNSAAEPLPAQFVAFDTNDRWCDKYGQLVDLRRTVRAAGGPLWHVCRRQRLRLSQQLSTAGAPRLVALDLRQKGGVMTDFLPYLGDVLAAVASEDAAQQRQRFERLLQIGAQTAWDTARPKVEEQLKQELGRPDRIANGFSLYDLDLRLAQQVSLTRAVGASSLAGAIPLQLRLGPDLLIAKSTQPTALGSEFDPKFSVDFAIVIDFSLNVQPERMSLSVEVGSAHLTGKDFSGNPYLDSQNVVADLAKLFAGTVVPWFGGPNYVELVESVLGQHDFSGVLNTALQPVNDVLGQLAKEGMGTLMALFPDASLPGALSAKAIALDSGPRESVALLVVAQPLAGDGVISGAIRWPKSAGAPELDPPFVGAFSLTASVDTGAAVGPFAQATNVTHLARFAYAGTDSDHVIEYVLSGLPTEKPITVDCATTAAASWSGDGTKIPMVERSGWSGAVTIHPGTGIASRLRPGMRSSGHGADVELNPQPIPPGRRMTTVEHAGLEKVALNPQPIPPGRTIAAEEAGFHPTASRGGAGTATVVSELQTAGRRIDPGRHGTAMAERENPTGAGEVSGIDFTVHLVDKPR